MNGRAMLLDEYLHTSFDNPDPEFREGHLVERSIADSLHGMAQGALGAIFHHRREFRLFACASTRMKLRENLYLVPDVAVFYRDEPTQSFPDHPPLIAAEILSPEDRFVAVRSKLDEYRAWGVPHVWLVDPHSRRFYTCDDRLMEVDTLRVPEFDLTVTRKQIFD
jgi:Uma2 family endonuclease